MSTALLERPIAEGLSATDDDIVHLICCDEDIALCGEDVSREPFVIDSPEDAVCPACEIRESQGPGCPACDGGSDGRR